MLVKKDKDQAVWEKVMRNPQTSTSVEIPTAL